MNSNLLVKLLLLLLLPSVLPASLVNDRRMEVAARTSYVYSQVLADRVKVSAEFGVLTLTGTVEDVADRQLAEDTARNIRWVVDVQNKLTLQPSFREQSDEWIGLKVLARLRLHAQVNAATTRVSVMDGMVTLAGTARDDSQRQRTAHLAAEVPGVHHVRNQLVVSPPLPGESAPAEHIDDASIVALVLAAWRDQTDTRTMDLKATATEGTVRITGPSASTERIALVTQLARDAHGVRFVSNLMKPGQ